MRNVGLALLVGFSVLASSSADAQEVCTDEGFTNDCQGGTTLEYCSAEGIVETLDCSAFPLQAVCGAPPCAAGCTELEDECLALESGICSLQAPPIEDEYLLCAAGLSCRYDDSGLSGETCVDWGDNPTCDGDVDGVGCLGNVATLCLFTTTGVAFELPVSTDCSAFDSQCAEGENGFSVCYGGADAACDDLTLRPFSLLWCQPGYACQGTDADNPRGTCQPVADAGPATDGGSSIDDGGFTFPDDAGDAEDDGGQTSVDGGGPPPPDGGQTPTDGGGQTPTDAGQTPTDGGLTQTDAGDDPPVGVDGGVFGACAGGVTALGECEGDTLRYCQAGVVEEIDCAASDRVCAELGPTAGFNCVRPDDVPPPADEETPQSLFLLCRCATPGAAAPAAAWLALLAGAFVLRPRRRSRKTR